jgi:hypothetical protein
MHQQSIIIEPQLPGTLISQQSMFWNLSLITYVFIYIREDLQNIKQDFSNIRYAFGTNI